MRLRRRQLIGTLLATPFILRDVASAVAEDDEALAYYRQPKIDWRQAQGQSLTIGLNKSRKPQGSAAVPGWVFLPG